MTKTMTMNSVAFAGANMEPSVFSIGEEGFAPRRWFGLTSIQEGLPLPFRMSSWFDVFTSLGTLHERNISLDVADHKDDALTLEWQLYEGALRYKSRLVFDADTGVWSRKDRIVNTGETSVEIYRALPQFVFAPGRFEAYYQTGRWCYENDGNWSELENLHLESEGGRTTQGATPFVALRSRDSRDGVAFHLVPNGNWQIVVKTPSPGVGQPYNDTWIQLQIGHSAYKLRMPLPAGQSWELPELIIQGVPGGRIERAAPLLHRYWASRPAKPRELQHPVVYNPWFDVYANLNQTDRLRQHLEVARKLGCEVFEIDAGWYGAEEGDWWQQAGDWRERQDGAFRGNMRSFVDEVHAAGLKFGLWMEPERFGENVPIRREHPDWFSWGNGYYRPKLEEPEVYAYLLAEISRLIETYSLVWFKFDFNFEFGEDEYGTNFHAYYNAWYRMLDELKEKYPHVFFEACAAGGQRSDLHTISRFDAHFLSDNVNPWDSLTAYQQGVLRLPPHRLLKWLVVQPGGGTSLYGMETYSQVPTVVAPAPPGAGFDRSETVDLDFACLAASAGPFGVSGNFVDFSDEQLEQVKAHIDFYKKWRNFFKSSCLHMNREPRRLGDRSGWSSMQFKHLSEDVSLLYVFRLDDALGRVAIPLQELDRSRQYEVSGGGETRVLDGAELMDVGLETALDARHRAVVYTIMPRGYVYEGGGET